MFTEDCVFKKFEDNRNKINCYTDEDDENYKEFKRLYIRDDFKHMNLDSLKIRSESPINQKEKYLTFCKPFEKLKEFARRVGII